MFSYHEVILTCTLNAFNSFEVGAQVLNIFKSVQLFGISFIGITIIIIIIIIEQFCCSRVKQDVNTATSSQSILDIEEITDREAAAGKH